MKKAVILFNILIFSLFCNVQLHAQQNEFIVAENYFRNNDYQKAVHLYKKLHNKSPYNTLYLKRLVTSYQETNQFLVADALLSERIKEKPNLVFLNIIKGYNFERQQKDIQANKEYQIALNSLDKKRNYGATIARLFKEYNKLDFAIEVYTKIITNNPKANYGFQLAQLYGEKGNFKKMFDSYVSLVDKDEKYLNNVKRYTSKYIDENPENENNILFKKALLRKAVSNPKNCWNDLLSWLFITQKQYSKALIQQKALVARNPDYLNKIHQLGEISLENKDYETAKNCFDFIIEKTNYPTDKFKAINNNLKIAIRTKQANIPEKFQAIFSQYSISKNTLEIQITYANYLTFTENTPEKAIKILQKALTFANSKFEKAAIKLKLGEVLVYTNNFNKALIYFSQVQTQFKNHFLGQEARFKVAQTSYFKNDFTWAKAQLKVLKSSATQLIANDAANLFLTITDNQPKDSISTGLKQYAKADLLAFQNKDTQAISILTNLITNYKGQPIQDEALFKQAGLFIKQQKYEAAIFNYNKIIALDKNGIYVDDVYYQMAELYRTKLNNPEKAKEYYQKIIFDHASSIYLIDARKQFRQLRTDQL
ncbi:tetratricopeptide repeat protein [Tenacibaculum dicentrarchi]|nr:tetratricopeptide repeat protein [Tenacibaculum dicentrarchi]MCD8419342.1 tetratricopeptide repeat protein [Tenacibaculum dicentrarchi]MCD8436323.1 tetratricopeptide repeat protein [Tenacibaculum dicentrarchi]MCD8451149.1 tetratricopeptide repeat protein [Tenacibaculum dicentrarchi]MCG8827257.1 tetratricopeptide repeat protein [Tenacibaculum dicentrarchi]